MKVESESDIIHAIQHGYDVEFPSRIAYEAGRLFMLDFAEYCVDNNEWEWFHTVQEKLDKADAEFAPPGGWVPARRGVSN